MAKLRRLEHDLRKHVEQLEAEAAALRDEAKELLASGKRDLAKKKLRRKQARSAIFEKTEAYVQPLIFL